MQFASFIFLFYFTYSSQVGDMFSSEGVLFCHELHKKVLFMWFLQFSLRH